MGKVTDSEFDEYKYHNWKLCKLGLGFPLSSVSHYPLEIQIEVSTYCNIQCVMCTRPLITTNPKHLPTDIMNKLFPLFPSAVKVVPFGGGEPLLYPHFKDIVEHAKHCRAQVTFNTNGLLLNESLSRTFVSLGVDLITFSLDGVTENTYQTIRKGSNYAKVMHNLQTLGRLIKEYDRNMLTLGIAFVPMVDNFLEIPELFSLVSKLGIQRIFFETLISPDRDWSNEYKDFYRRQALSNLVPIELTSYMREYATLAQRLSLQIYPADYFSSFLDRPESSSVQDKAVPYKVASGRQKNFGMGIREKHRGTIACTLPWTSIYVNADGLVQTCCMSSRVFGDLKVQEFSEIWNGKEFQQYRNQFIQQDCPVECQNCLANGRNRETIPSLTKQQLLSSWKESSWEIINRFYRKLQYPFPH